ncbi:MAG: hypothetical protein ABSH33_17260 [Steroidobacteraceae bacterium]
MAKIKNNVGCIFSTGVVSAQFCNPADETRYDGASYATFDDFMTLADELEPLFLIVHQFNEFNTSDEGWNANTSDDIEPTQTPRGWGYSAIQAVHDRIERYRQRIPDNQW